MNRSDPVAQTTSPGDAVTRLLRGEEQFISIAVTPSRGVRCLERQLHHVAWSRRRHGHDVWITVKVVLDALDNQWVVARLRAKP